MASSAQRLLKRNFQGKQVPTGDNTVDTFLLF